MHNKKRARDILSATRSADSLLALAGYSGETEAFRSVLAAAQVPAFIYRRNRMNIHFPGIKTLYYDGFVWRDPDNGYDKNNGPASPLQTGVLMAKRAWRISDSAGGVRNKGREDSLYAFPRGVWFEGKLLPTRFCASAFFPPDGGMENFYSPPEMTSALEAYMRHSVITLLGKGRKFADELLYGIYRMELALARPLPFPLPDSIMDSLWNSVSNLREPVLSLEQFSERVGFRGYARHREEEIKTSFDGEKEKEKGGYRGKDISIDTKKFPWMSALFSKEDRGNTGAAEK